MSRIKRGVTTRAKHKRILEQAKGYYGRRKNTIRIARQAVEKAGQYAYRDRKVKKRSFRALWIQRINAAVRAEGVQRHHRPGEGSSASRRARRGLKLLATGTLSGRGLHGIPRPLRIKDIKNERRHHPPGRAAAAD